MIKRLFWRDSFFKKIKIFIIYIIISFISLSCRSPQKPLLKSSPNQKHYRPNLCNGCLNSSRKSSPIVEVKATDHIISEHKAQVINYLAVSGMLVGLIINFGQAKVQTTRLEHPGYKVPSKIPSCISCSS